MKKKAMILGAGIGQIPFINLLKERGCYVIAVSVKGNYPGFEIADKCYYVDTRDKEAILEIAREEGIDIITTDQTDVSVPAVAYVAEKMGLKGIGCVTAEKFTDKYVMRCYAENAGIPVPKFIQVNCVDNIIDKVSRMDYPLISKPVNSSGSRGVHRIDNPNELVEKVKMSLDSSVDNKVIIEEFIEGKEYLADGIALDGDYITLDFGIKEYFDLPDTYISKMCMFSSSVLAKNEAEIDVVKTNTELVNAFNLPFGITHAEYIYSEKRHKTYLVEIAARGGRVYLSSHLTPRASGVNSNVLLIDYLTENKIANFRNIKLDQKVSCWRCFALKPGFISKIQNVEEIRQIPGVTEAFLDDLTIGMKIGELKDDTCKLGPILFLGNNREECYDAIQKVKDTLCIETTDENNNISGIIW